MPACNEMASNGIAPQITTMVTTASPDVGSANQS